MLAPSSSTSGCMPVMPRQRGLSSPVCGNPRTVDAGRRGLAWLPWILDRFDAAVYARRLAAAAAAAADAGLAGLVITPGYDLRYLIGSRAQTFERLTALVLPAVRRADRRGAAAGAGLAQGVRGRRTRPGGAGLGRRRGSVPAGRRRARRRPGRDRCHRLHAGAAPAAAGRRARRGAGAGHRRAAPAADGQGRQPRSTRCARPVRRSTGCTPGCRSSCVPGRTEADVAADIARSDCRRRAFGGGVHHRRLGPARRRPAPRVLGPRTAGRRHRRRRHRRPVRTRLQLGLDPHLQHR